MPRSKGQKAVQACMIRLLNLGPTKHEKVAIYVVNQRISNICRICGSCFAAEQFVGISWRQQKTQLPTVLRSTVRKLCHNRTDQPAECRSVRGPESLDAATSSELNSSRRYKTCILIACRDNIPQIIWHLIYP